MTDKEKLLGKIMMAVIVSLLPAAILTAVNLSTMFVLWSFVILPPVVWRVGLIFGLCVSVGFWLDTDDQGKCKK